MLYIFNAGGFVMWPLLIFSLISCYCVVERIIFWQNINWHNNNSRGEIITNYFNSSESFLHLLKSDNTYPLFSILLKAIKFDKCSEDSFHLALSSAFQSEVPSLKKHTNILSTIITISPLLGLLGTVLGLIESFSFISIGETGANNIRVTGGISEALISTASGLIVAICSLLFLNFFKFKFQKELTIIQEFLVKFEIVRTEKTNIL